jgi:hypothetical protein
VKNAPENVYRCHRQLCLCSGRYYYDNASSQGIDWTEDDTGSWPYVVWVTVCDNSGNNRNKYW